MINAYLKSNLLLSTFQIYNFYEYLKIIFHIEYIFFGTFCLCFDDSIFLLIYKFYIFIRWALYCWCWEDNSGRRCKERNNSPTVHYFYGPQWIGESLTWRCKWILKTWKLKWEIYSGKFSKRIQIQSLSVLS